MTTAESKTAIDELNADERAAIVMLADCELTTEEILELINRSFHERHRAIILPPPDPR